MLGAIPQSVEQSVKPNAPAMNSRRRPFDAEGLAAVSMRRVADALGTGPASLYQHVASKDDLLELVFDAVAGEIELPDVDADDWQGATKQIVRAIRRTR